LTDRTTHAEGQVRPVARPHFPGWVTPLTCQSPTDIGGKTNRRRHVLEPITLEHTHSRFE